MQKYYINPELEPIFSLPPQHTSSIENHKDFSSTKNFYKHEGNSNSKIHDSKTDSSEHFLGYNIQSQNTFSQPTNNLLRTIANQIIFPFDPRFREIQELLIVKLCKRPSGLLNKKRSQKSHDFEQSTRRKPFEFENIKQNILAS